MRKSICLVFVLASSFLAYTQRESRAVAVTPTTAVEIKILEDLSSQTLHAGQPIAFEVDHDVMINETTLIPGRTPLTGEVTQVKAAGAAGKSGSLELILRPLQLADGTTVHLDFYRPPKRSGKKEKTVVAIATPFALLYYWPLIPIEVVQESRNHGQPYLVRAGERYVVYVTSLDKGPTTNPSAPPPAAATPETSPKPPSQPQGASPE